jgi:hypothetical protein
LDRCLEVLQNNLYNVTIKLSWYLFLQSRFLVLSARPTKIYCPCHLRNLLSHRALIYSWWAHPHGKMPSNIQSTMDKGQMARPVNHPALHTNQNMIFSCFLVHKWSQWSLPNSISWTRCSCVEPVGDANVQYHIWNYLCDPKCRMLGSKCFDTPSRHHYAFIKLLQMYPAVFLTSLGKTIIAVHSMVEEIVFLMGIQWWN